MADPPSTRRPGSVANVPDAAAMPLMRCAVCGRFRHYADDDRYCVECGHEGLERSCPCGRAYDYLRDATDDAAAHCPRCGTSIRGRAREYDG